MCKVINFNWDSVVGQGHLSREGWVDITGSRDGAVVRVLTSHQCGLGSTPGPGAICGLSLLLVLAHHSLFC